MAFPTAVNSQITDSVTQSGVHAVGDASAMSLGVVYQAAAQAALAQLAGSAHAAAGRSEAT